MSVKNEPVKLAGKVKVNNDSEGKKFAKMFFTGNFLDALKYGFENVLVPYTKDAICKTSTNIISCWVNGDRPSSSQSGNANRVSYWNGPNNQRPLSSAPNNARKSSGPGHFDVFEYELRGDAEVILTKMLEILETYKVVTVADLYDLNDQKTVYTNFKYGWTNLDNASVRPTGDGHFIIDLPKASPID